MFTLADILKIFFLVFFFAWSQNAMIFFWFFLATFSSQTVTYTYQVSSYSNIRRVDSILHVKRLFFWFFLGSSQNEMIFFLVFSSHFKRPNCYIQTSMIIILKYQEGGQHIAESSLPFWVLFKKKNLPLHPHLHHYQQDFKQFERGHINQVIIFLWFSFIW